MLGSNTNSSVIGMIVNRTSMVLALRKTNYECMYKQVIFYIVLSKSNIITALSVTDNIHNEAFAHMYVYEGK